MVINNFGDFLAVQPDKLRLSDSLLSEIKIATFNVVNFEAPVSGSGKPILKSGKNLCQPLESAQFMEDAGFNVILLANNHMMDYGEQGLQNTMSSFGKSVLVGAGDGKEAYTVKIIEHDGKKIGILSLVQKEFGVLVVQFNFFSQKSSIN